MGAESIAAKIVIDGTLTLDSPLLIGADAGMGGTNAGDRDVRVLKDESGTPFIPGTSMAGALRQCMKAEGYENEFAMMFGDMKTYQSSASVEDVRLENAAVVCRDGVRIDNVLGTSEDGGKYDYEVVERGARGCLRIELTLRGCHTDAPESCREAKILPKCLALAALLQERLRRGIRLGAMTSKGFGKIHSGDVRGGLYDFSNPEAVISWLGQDRPAAEHAPEKLASAVEIPALPPGSLEVSAEFALRSSFIIRDPGQKEKVKRSDGRKDTAIPSLRSNGDYVVPGTSIKGPLRHRAAYIFERMGRNLAELDKLMGTSDGKDAGGEAEGRIKSRFIVDETYLTGGIGSRREDAMRVADHTRNRIDRFTGGTIDGSLFTTRPLWQHDSRLPSLRIRFSVEKATEEDAGMALLLLRDLWQGRIALGGEKSVGRGTLSGISGSIRYRKESWSNEKTWTLDARGRAVQGDAKELEEMVKAFLKGSGAK